MSRANPERIQPSPTARLPASASRRGPTRSIRPPPKNIVVAKNARNVMNGRLPWKAVAPSTFSTAGLKMLQA
jgi:hypothetical protein